MLVDALLPWWAGTARDLPWRRDGTTAWGVLVSEVMLQQTPAARVVPAWGEWITRWPTPADLAADAPGEAVRQWQRLGYPRRALRLHGAAVACVERHDGQVPPDVEALLALPGVGAYTARAVACFAFGARVPVVDVNVRRVMARAVEGRAEGPAAVSRADLALVEDLLPREPEDARTVSAALMELGALVCVARSPRCDRCPLEPACAWRRAGSPPSTAPPRPGQGYAGTDRQVRGRLLQVLRDAPGAVAPEALAVVWEESVQRERALDGLLADGLAVRGPDGRVALPG